MTGRRVILVWIVFLVVLWPRMSESDIISYLRFEEGGGTTAQDHVGVMQGELMYMPSVQWSTDIPTPVIPLTGVANNYSLWFGGFGFVDLSNNNDVNLGTSSTVEFYMKPNDPGFGSLVFGLEPSSALYLAILRDGPENILSYSAWFMNEHVYGPATNISLGDWQHVALVKQPGEYTLYLNGVVLAAGTLPTSADGPYYFPGTGMTGDRTIGGESGTFSGWLDEFRISDEALTPDQFLNAVPEPGTWLLLLSGLGFLSSKFMPFRGRKR